jgi:nucleotide-binding universal stress UspA family protein
MEVEVPRAMVDRYFAEVVYQVKQAAEEAGTPVESVKVVKGVPADAILRHIREVGFDFVVLGHQRRYRRFSFLAGPTIRKVVARSPCTVVVVPK